MTITTQTYTLPASWASYVINGDASGIEDDEVIVIDAWLNKVQPGIPTSCSDEQFFSWHNDGPTPNIGGDCLEYEFIVL